MSTYMLSHTLVIILCVNLMSVSSRKISDDNTIRKRDRRQFSGSFGSISVPFFQYTWGNHQNGWYGPGFGYYGYGGNLYGPRLAVRRRFWRRRWRNWDGFYESFGGHEFRDGFGGP
ncbi:unnamed protein product [Onchocerca flexuosa]|uniref:Neuropeptide-like protein 31 n=1 Tax=Onchocerca flexuosa TaxID=387005 RepID=A0A183HTP6_9BILA|nr:unnamed protein product [Onchocerca flexuosa]